MVKRQARTHQVLETAPKKHELVVVLPNSIAAGDPGDPLTGPATCIIRVLAACGYAPDDFGLSDKSCTELWFVRLEGPDAKDRALKQARFFIDNGGAIFGQPIG